MCIASRNVASRHQHSHAALVIACSRTNLVYAFYLLTAAFYYPRFRSLPPDGGHKRELAMYVARVLQFRLGYTFELKSGDVIDWDHSFVIDKVGKRIQGQDVIAFSYDKLYSVGVPGQLADNVRRVIDQFQLPVNLEVSGALFVTIVSAQRGFGFGKGDANGTASAPLEDPSPPIANNNDSKEESDDIEEEEIDDNWFDMLLLRD
jgi:hypothetical protein